jgi:hypothetical protein
MPRKEPSQEPPRHSRNEELGGSREERNRHLRYAHEQYSGSGQGRFGAPEGRKLPLEKPQRQRRSYPPGTRMPWPSDEIIETKSTPRRKK